MTNDKYNMLPEVFPVACHTDAIGPGSTFVAVKGMKHDGATFIEQALKKGATRIVCSSDSIVPEECSVEVIRVPEPRLALAQLSAAALDFPSKKLKIIGITGTKGKSTTTFLIEHILRSAGKKTALLSTIKNRIDGRDVPTKLTTQQPDYLHVFFDACVRQGVEWVVMECAAQAFSLHRIAGIEFDAAIFTNFAREHGEFYVTQDDYFDAKKQIITHLKPGAPLFLNGHDERVAALADLYENALLFEPQADLVCPALIGEFNRFNSTVSAMCCERLGIEMAVVKKALATFAGAPGRFEKYVLPHGGLVVIDYAHNPLSYQAVLHEVRKLSAHVIVVFGCGGERDSARRPIMGQLASHYADLVVLTNDNPRSEDPQGIVNDILAGISEGLRHKVIVELDRARAIKCAYEHSTRDSIIALLGKGPDEYQIIGDVVYPFSEKNIVKSL